VLKKIQFSEFLDLSILHRDKNVKKLCQKRYKYSDLCINQMPLKPFTGKGLLSIFKPLLSPRLRMQDVLGLK